MITLPYSCTIAAEITEVGQQNLQKLVRALAIDYQQAAHAAYHAEPATPDSQRAAAYYSRSVREFLGIEEVIDDGND